MTVNAAVSGVFYFGDCWLVGLLSGWITAQSHTSMHYRQWWLFYTCTSAGHHRHRNRTAAVGRGVHIGHDMLMHPSGAAYLSSVIHIQPGSLSPSSAFRVMSSFLTPLRPTFLNSGLPTVLQPSKHSVRTGVQILQVCCLRAFAADLLAWANCWWSAVVDRDVSGVPSASDTTADP